ncbi:MAG: sigma 54-interacting transcriptional regulator [Thermoanaerobaculia bacterium]|nr:sigma 54-interacting transcriptional regulator [Thermoanaerobaculia bacterium]
MTDALPEYRLTGLIDDQEVFYELGGAHQILVGSSPECDLRLRASGVSRRHAQLTAREGGLVVEDLGSKNGTFVEGERVQRAAAGAGMRLSFGTVDLTIECLTDGLNLAIRFEAPAGKVSTLATASPTETLILSMAGSDRDPLELQQLERILAGWPFTHAEQAMAALGESLDLVGACWLKWQGTTPLALGIWGQLGEVPTAQQVRYLLDSARPAADASAVVTGTLGEDRAAWIAAYRVAGVLYALVAWSSPDGPTPSLALLRTVTRLIPVRHGETPAVSDRQGFSLEFPDGYIRGGSAPMLELYRRMSALVESQRPVLIVGETGVGKELIAHAVHRSSTRSEGPFLAVNCAALPENLLESELFGIVKGAASGIDARPGYFARTEGGTLFLDEIGELPSSMQAKLLRTLQQNEIQPVGGTPRSVDVRIVAATNIDPETDVEPKQKLRPDLFFRFVGGLLRVPPLRDCPDDISRLVRRILERASQEEELALHGVTTRAMESLRSYPWPGNVRELEQEMWRIVTDRPTSGIVDLDALSLRIRSVADRPEDGQLASQDDLRLKPRIEALQRRFAREAMVRTGGHVTKAARLLGLSRVGLTKMLDRLGLKETWARPPST